MTETIRYATEHDGTMTIRGYPTAPITQTEERKERPVTLYHERLEAGEYLDNGDEAEADEGNGPTLAELRAQADERGIPNYGKKAQIAERIAKYDSEQAEAPAEPVEDEAEPSE